jgi:hypothetical protein
MDFDQVFGIGVRSAQLTRVSFANKPSGMRSAMRLSLLIGARIGLNAAEL